MRFEVRVIVVIGTVLVMTSGEFLAQASAADRPAATSDVAPSPAKLQRIETLIERFAAPGFQPRVPALRQLVAIGRDAVEPLIAALGNGQEQRTRAFAAEALGKIGDRRAVGPLMAALKDRELWVRGLAAEALGRLGEAKAVEPLIAMLKTDPSGHAAKQAAIALGAIKDPRGIPPLIDALWHKDNEVGTGARNGLPKFGPPIVEPLIAAFGRQGSYFGRLRIAGYSDKSNRLAQSTAC